METIDDLLIKRRRGALAPADERRLETALRASREYELALLAHDTFERDGEPRAGDSERLDALIGAIERRLRPEPPPLRVWRVPLRAAIPILIAGAAAAAVGGVDALGSSEPAQVIAAPAARDVSITRGLAAPLHGPTVAHEESAPPAEQPALPVEESTPPAEKPAHAEESARPAEPPAPAVEESVAPAEPPAPAVEASVAPVASLEGGRVAQSEEAPALSARSRAVAPTEPATRRERGASSAPHVPGRSAAENTQHPESAQSLFQRANHLRQSDWPAAARLYLELIQRHPTSNEAGVSEVALGKWSFAQGRSGDALEWFRAYQRRGPGALTAEALFGEARALESIGSVRAAREPWRRLLESHAHTPYANVARQRLGVP